MSTTSAIGAYKRKQLLSQLPRLIHDDSTHGYGCGFTTQNSLTKTQCCQPRCGSRLRFVLGEATLWAHECSYAKS